MSWWTKPKICKPANSGYRGQRYEVRALRPVNEVTPEVRSDQWEPFVVGWTELEDGGSLVRMVKRHPSWRTPKVVDLGEDEWKRDPGKNLADTFKGA